MADQVFVVLVVLTALACGMTAGALFAFSSLVMRGLPKLPAHKAIEAMQAIDSAVGRSAFVLTFTGAGVAALVVAVWSVTQPAPTTVFVVVGAVLYIGGVIVLTRVVHLPRNAALHRVDPQAPDSEEWWRGYVAVWVPWNHVRTAAGLLATASLITGALQV